ncbi:MAG: hypothetical protein WCI74_13910, partial [Actinomycetes bacterium]
AQDARSRAGDGQAAGPSVGAQTQLGAYQYNIPASSNAMKYSMFQFGLAALCLLGGALIAGVFYRRNRVRP